MGTRDGPGRREIPAAGAVQGMKDRSGSSDIRPVGPADPGETAGAGRTVTLSRMDPASRRRASRTVMALGPPREAQSTDRDSGSDRPAGRGAQEAQIPRRDTRIRRIRPAHPARRVGWADRNGRAWVNPVGIDRSAGSAGCLRWVGPVATKVVAPWDSCIAPMRRCAEPHWIGPRHDARGRGGVGGDREQDRPGPTAGAAARSRTPTRSIASGPEMLWCAAGQALLRVAGRLTIKAFGAALWFRERHRGDCCVRDKPDPPGASTCVPAANAHLRPYPPPRREFGQMYVHPALPTRCQIRTIRAGSIQRNEPAQAIFPAELDILTSVYRGRSGG